MRDHLDNWFIFSAIGTFSDTHFAALQLDYFTNYAEFSAASSASKGHCMV